MLSINKCILFLSLALCGSALTTPHVARQVNNRRSLNSRCRVSAPDASNTTVTTSADSSPTPAVRGALPSFMSGTQTGQGTFYGTGLGACGITNSDSDHIAAVSHLLFDSFPGYNGGNPNTNPICGKQVTAHYQGKSVTVTITDRCEGCALTDLDFSPAAFNTLADPSIGRISGVTWSWS